MADVFADAGAYERFMGAWSRRVAPLFLEWLGAPASADWVDVGCGTGALTAAVLGSQRPASVLGVDPSAAFVAAARAVLARPGVRFAVGHGAAVDLPDAAADVVVSGLALNFAPDADAVLAEHRRVVRPGGLAAAYVWDYAEGMTVLREFWRAAAEVDPVGGGHDEGARFPLCRPEALADLWRRSGLVDVDVTALEVERTFPAFDDLWQPFLGGQGAGPTYLVGRPPDVRDAVREALRRRLPAARDGSVHLTARAWAVRGRRPGARAAAGTRT